MITSKSNNLIKLINSLNKKKYRDKENAFIIEGKKFVDDTIIKNIAIKYLVCTEDFSCEYENPLVVSQDVFKYICSTKTPQGVLAIIEKPRQQEDLIDNNENILYLDNVQDSVNVGGLIRSSVCADFKSVILSPSCADPYQNKAVRASAGSILSTKVYIDDNYSLLSKLKENDFNIIASTINGKEETSFPTSKNVLIVGNEGNGISKEALALSTMNVKIPMSDRCESLNANVSGAILMYKIFGY